MTTAIHTQLRVPAEGRLLALVQGHIRDLARAAGFTDKEVLALELAAEEAFLNICQHAYPDGSQGNLLVDCELLESELRLEFHDEGLPFDPAFPNRHRAKSDSETAGLGLRLIHYSVDEVRWINRGREGKALCLVKRRPETGEIACLQTGQSGPGVEMELNGTPEQTYEIRLLRREDALQVARLFWRAYGYSYKNEAFYRPEGLLDLVARGTLISYVAVTADGEVAGHAGLLRPEPVPMAEMALLVVSPAHRGHGLMERFATTLGAKGEEIGLFGVSFNPVTSHPISQRQVISSGGQPCGLELAACPPRLFKAMELKTGPGHRESYLHCFKYLKAPPPALAYVPERHLTIIERIYANLGRPLTQVCNESSGGPGEDTGFYTVTFDRGLSKGIVRVSVAEERQWPEIRRAATDLMEIAGAEVVHIDLPIAQSASLFLCEQAEAEGFFFAGIWPHAAQDSDMLRLTRLAALLDLSLLKLHSDFTHELAHYVKVEMTRAKGMGTPRSH